MGTSGRANGFRNGIVTYIVSNAEDIDQEMTAVRAALLSFLMLSGLAIGGFGIYAADAAADHHAVDGYGISAAR